ncbi:alpha-galactosidase A precursor [Hypoxylon fuscum]|nr:alpha-galactosidase A precursor [Hypoxylon fuscum]
MTVQVLQASFDEDVMSEFRLLIDNKFVKYVTIDPGIFERDDLCFAPSLISLMPALPSGDWNTAHIARDTVSGDPAFTAISNRRLRGITKIWHATQIDHLDFHLVHKLRTNVYKATCAHFDTPVIVKLARFEWEIARLEAETIAYEWINGQQIGPEFLRHLIEEGRVIGFILSNISECRHATIEDYALCYEALSKLHRLGIKHGDINKHNFLVHDGKAALIDFDTSSREAQADELEGELRELGDQLRDTSGRGGRVVVTSPS